jgi:hypothetical protein
MERGLGAHGLSPDVIRDAGRHVESCGDCSRKVSEYRHLLIQIAKVAASEPTSAGIDCPHDGDVEWHEVAAGLCEELKAKQLIIHAALCDHCGPRLRAATSVNEPTAQEEKLLAELKAPSRPVVQHKPEPIPPSLPIWRQFLQWKISAPALALMTVIAVLVSTKPPSPPLSGPLFAEFAVLTHRHSEGRSALDVRSESLRTLNEWFKAKVPFPLALPASPPFPGEERPYRLEGAQLVPLGGKTAVYIAYQMQTGPVGLMVAPDSLAVASGGVEAEFKKVTFHYRTLEGYKVVTWSLHGNTYALVSQEGNRAQGSCMVCHSAMRDRDLTHTPTPLRAEQIFQ